MGESLHALLDSSCVPAAHRWRRSSSLANWYIRLIILCWGVSKSVLVCSNGLGSEEIPHRITRPATNAHAIYTQKYSDAFRKSDQSIMPEMLSARELLMEWGNPGGRRRDLHCSKLPMELHIGSIINILTYMKLLLSLGAMYSIIIPPCSGTGWAQSVEGRLLVLGDAKC